MSPLEQTLKLVDKQISIYCRRLGDQFDENDVLRVHRMHLISLLPNAEYLLHQEKDQLLFVLFVQLSIALLLLDAGVGSIEIRDASRWLTQLNLSELVNVDAGDHGVLVLVQLTLERHKLKLRVEDDWNESVWQHRDLI